MKKLVAIMAAVLLSSCFTSFSSAHQDHSFLNTATSGLFEETYDLFNISPAYLPSFQKNAFWGQLSNLFDQNDSLVGNSSSTNQYLLGGEMDAMGMGRIGLMGDWYSHTAGVSNQTWNSTTSFNGFGENDIINYRDRNGDNIIDYRDETYGRSEKTSNTYNNDIYLAYGLGGLGGFDLGLGVRGTWDSNKPSYDANLPGFSTTFGSFDDKGWERQTDLITGQPIYSYDRECTKGSLSYGSSEWDITLAGRSKDLLPGIDLLLNVTPIIVSTTNALDWAFTEYTNNYPGGGNISDLRHNQSETGIEQALLPTDPVSDGMGIGVGARFDMATSFTGAKEQNDHLVLDLGFKTTSSSVKKDKDKNQSVDETLGRTSFFDGTQTALGQQDATTTQLNTWDGTVTFTEIKANLKGLWANQGWDFGIGIGTDTQISDTELTNVYSYNQHIRQDYFGDDTYAFNNAYSSDQNYGDTQMEKSKTVTNDITLPVAMQFHFLKNFAVQISAMHTIELKQTDSSTSTKERILSTTVKNNDNGTSSTTVPANSGQLTEATSTSEYDVTQTSSFAYGVTWWPYEQVRIDITGLTYLVYLNYYRFSVSLYF